MFVDPFDVGKEFYECDGHSVLFPASIEWATTVVQGRVGNCWLLAALAALGSLEGGRDKLRSLLSGSVIEGYKVRLFCWPQHIVVDGRLPADSDGTPTYAFPVKEAGKDILWVSILEKAFAKLHGGYEALDGGYSSEVFQALGLGCRDLVKYDIETTIQRCGVSFASYLSKLFLRHPMVCSFKDGESFHAFALIAFDANSDSVVLWNPHGKKEVILLTDFFSRVETLHVCSFLEPIVFAGCLKPVNWESARYRSATFVFAIPGDVGHPHEVFFNVMLRPELRSQRKNFSLLVRFGCSNSAAPLFTSCGTPLRNIDSGHSYEALVELTVVGEDELNRDQGEDFTLIVSSMPQSFEYENDINHPVLKYADGDDHTKKKEEEEEELVVVDDGECSFWSEDDGGCRQMCLDAKCCNSDVGNIDKVQEHNVSFIEDGSKNTELKQTIPNVNELQNNDAVLQRRKMLQEKLAKEKEEADSNGLPKKKVKKKKATGGERNLKMPTKSSVTTFASVKANVVCDNTKERRKNPSRMARRVAEEKMKQHSVPEESEEGSI